MRDKTVEREIRKIIVDQIITTTQESLIEVQGALPEEMRVIYGNYTPDEIDDFRSQVLTDLERSILQTEEDRDCV